MSGNTLPTFRDWLGAVSKGFSKEAHFKGLGTVTTTVAEKMHEKEVRK
jgi:hypothetical protein